MKFYYSIFLLLVSLNNILSQSHQEVIKFESANPFSLNDIIENLDLQEKQKVSGKLRLPIDNENLNKKFPLIIGVAGSLGWADHHFEYLKMYREMGIATFELNSFKSREITSTVGTQNEVTIAAIILDAYRAFEILSKHPRIDRDRISITGWSLGGGVTLFSAWLPINNAINQNVKFKSHLAFYPPCFFEPENIQFSDSPIHILIGELDNWTPAKPCEGFVSKLKNNSANINLTIYEGSHHSFDKDSPVIRNENAYNFSDCLFKLTEDGNILMNYLNIPMSNSFLQKLGFMFCVSRGVNYGGNPVSREKSFAFAKKFMRETLLED
ncbi:MAG: dienelactone hydrolase family protein [Cytophagales bacterium]